MTWLFMLTCSLHVHSPLNAFIPFFLLHWVQPKQLEDWRKLWLACPYPQSQNSSLQGCSFCRFLTCLLSDKGREKTHITTKATKVELNNSRWARSVKVAFDLYAGRTRNALQLACFFLLANNYCWFCSSAPLFALPMRPSYCKVT